MPTPNPSREGNLTTDPAPEPFELDAAALLDEPDDAVEFLLDGLLPKTGLACLSGTAGLGKSCLLRQLALAVAGDDATFLDWKLNLLHASAIYVATEDGKQGLRQRLRRQSAGRTRQQLKNLRLVLNEEDLLANLDDALTARPADLVVVDSFEDAYGGDLREAQRIRKFLRRYERLAEKHGCLVLFVFHTDKLAEKCMPGGDNVPGGEGFAAKMRTVLELRKDVKIAGQRHLCVLKGMRLPGNGEPESRVLRLDVPTLSFSNTGERTAVELLIAQPSYVPAFTKYWQAFQLHEEGLSYEEIAKRMGYSAKSTVAAIFQRARDEGWDKLWREKGQRAEDGFGVMVTHSFV